MLSIFNKYPSGETGIALPTNWDYIKTGYLRNLQKVKEFYQTYPSYVNSSHLLVRIIESFAVSTDLPLPQYYRAVDAMSSKIAMTFKMTSPYFKGKQHEGVFYGDGSTEILLLVDDYFYYNQINDDWQNAKSVYPIMHPKSDMDLIVPNGKSYSKEKGLSVIGINLAMLMVQYRAFVKAQPSADARTITQFIGSFVLPNMLDAHLDIALFNRLYKASYGINDGFGETHYRHSFTMPHYTAHLDHAIETILENIRVSVPLFSTVLKSVPAFGNTNIYQSLILPDIAPSMQVDWALIAARLKVYDFLIKMTGQYASIKNQDDLSQILRAFHINSVRSMLEQMLPSNVTEELSVYTEHLMQANNRDFL